MDKNISEEKIQEFQKKIFSWWETNRRDFPWRITNNPYHILVSEFMLQQTQTSRVMRVYENFLKNWPTKAELAEEASSNVIKFWSENRLGYNRRAKWLHEAIIYLNKLDAFPKDPKELRKIKGIGSYSSRSILIFAFNHNLATIDTNIRRILIDQGFANEETKDSELLSIAEKLLPHDKSRDWHNALMDYGAILKTARKTGIKPRTRQKPFKNSTRAHRGSIIRLLSSQNGGSFEEISAAIKISKESLNTILSSLINDQMITEKDGKYFI
jgi:A/G-specific adenine glycosylase